MTPGHPRRNPNWPGGRLRTEPAWKTGKVARLMDLSIVIVNWNSSDFLLECIASILAYTRGIAYEVIVVDNASSEEDLARLEAGARDAVIIRSRDNLGFA